MLRKIDIYPGEYAPLDLAAERLHEHLPFSINCCFTIRKDPMGDVAATLGGSLSWTDYGMTLECGDDQLYTTLAATPGINGCGAGGGGATMLATHEVTVACNGCNTA